MVPLARYTLNAAVFIAVCFAIGAVHVIWSERMYRLYHRWTRGRKLWYMPQAVTPRATRLYGWLFIGVAAASAIGATLDG
jgi:hypothetical protein